MNIQQHPNQCQFRINRYQPGQIWVNEQPYNNSLIISPERFEPGWNIDDYSDFQANDFNDWLTDSTSLIIVGTGTVHQHISPALLLPFYQQGIGVEVMSSEKAAYTYTILSEEGRNIIAGIILEKT